MSTELTFRQKLIRLSSGAAICGLSLSFLLGEAVDTQAKHLRGWVVEPRLFPTAFLPLNPILQSISGFQTEDWQKVLIATNSLSFPQGQETSLFIAQKNQAPVFVRAAPARKAAADSQNEITSEDVVEILSSIHRVEAGLASSGKGLRNIGHEMPVSESKTIKETLGEPSTPVRTLAASGFVGVAAFDTAGVRKERSWSVRGSIVDGRGNTLEAGHFEVGLYTKMDPDGRPIGFPISQRILPAGERSFKLDVPKKVNKGYVFAEFVSKKGKRTLAAPKTNPWTPDTVGLAELYLQKDDSLTTVSSGPAPVELAKETWTLRGSVNTLFVKNGAIPQADVLIKVRGRKEATRTDIKGDFSIELPKAKGVVFLELLKSGYHPSIIGVTSGDERPVRVEIASRHATEQIGQRLGLVQASSLGVFFAQISGSDGTGIRGAVAQLGLKADGPFYFDDDGNISRDLKATSQSGRFLFLNVESGTGFLETTINGEQIAPVQISSVEGGELIQKSLMPVSATIKGRVFDPVAPQGRLQPISGARVRLDGTSEWVLTDAFGAFSLGPIKLYKGERVALELSAERFNNHKYAISSWESSSPLNLFVFPAQYLAKLARNMDVDLDPYSAIVVGKVSGPSLRIDALADHATVNTAKDFYIDSRGRLRGSHEMTDPRFGTYIIFNVPKGRVLLQGNDASGVLRYSSSVAASPSCINVEME